MKRFFAGMLSIALAAGLLAGCSVTQVHVCPPQENAQETETPAAPAAEGSVKTGLAVLTSLDGSAGAGAEEPGSASFDVTLAAVTVDDAGVIGSCVIDGVQARAMAPRKRLRRETEKPSDICFLHVGTEVK